MVYLEKMKNEFSYDRNDREPERMSYKDNRVIFECRISNKIDLILKNNQDRDLINLRPMIMKEMWNSTVASASLMDFRNLIIDRAKSRSESYLTHIRRLRTSRASMISKMNFPVNLKPSLKKNHPINLKITILISNFKILETLETSATKAPKIRIKPVISPKISIFLMMEKKIPNNLNRIPVKRNPFLICINNRCNKNNLSTKII